MGLSKVARRRRIRYRIRRKLTGTSTRPRACIYRSNTQIYCQLVDDVAGITILSVSSLKLKVEGTRCDVAKEVGKLLGSKASDKGISNILFDRGGYLYHGRIKALAEGAREAGLKF